MLLVLCWAVQVLCGASQLSFGLCRIQALAEVTIRSSYFKTWGILEA